MPAWDLVAENFLLTFPALFSIVNPLGGALIYAQVTRHWDHRTRVTVAGRIGLYSLAVMGGAIWGGAYVLSFFGISLAALRIAGGFVVAETAYRLLSAPEAREARKEEQAAGALDPADSALFPLTIPFTAGPGTISVAIALSANHPTEPTHLAAALVGDGLAVTLIAIMVWLSYRSADYVVDALGKGGARTMSRLAAFLLLCIGVQVLLGGIKDVIGH
jgi:multiple antibiotic resistance protein